MAGAKRSSSGPPASPGGSRRKRPVPTIDLTATEIAPQAARPAATARAAPGPAEPAAGIRAVESPRGPAADFDPRPDTMQGEMPRDPPHAPPRAAPPKQAAWIPEDLPWGHISAGIAGGIGVMAIFALLWLVGAFTPRDSGSAALAARLAAIEMQLREMAARPAPAGIDPKAIDDLAARMARIEAASASPRPPAVDPVLAARLASAETASRALSDNIAALTRRVDDTLAAAREAGSRATTAQAAAHAAAAIAAAAAEQAKARPTPPSVDRGEVDALASRVASLERTNKSLEAELARRAATPPAERAVRLAVAAAALRDAVVRAEPFAAELDTVRLLLADPSLLSPLAPHAATGVPTSAALGKELSALIPALTRAAGAAPREGGFLDRLQANAERLVRVRPVGVAPGDDPLAIVTRVELRAEQNEIAAARAELAKLPPDVRSPAEAWIGKAEARNAAIDASRRIAADALGALARPKS